jgi:hypothetical protein
MWDVDVGGRMTGQWIRNDLQASGWGLSRFQEGTIFPVYAMQTYKRSRGIAPLILNLGTRWRYGQIQAPAALPPGKNTCTNLIGGWVGPRASLYVFEKRKVS